MTITISPAQAFLEACFDSSKLKALDHGALRKDAGIPADDKRPYLIVYSKTAPDDVLRIPLEGSVAAIRKEISAKHKSDLGALVFGAAGTSYATATAPELSAPNSDELLDLVLLVLEDAMECHETGIHLEM